MKLFYLLTIGLLLMGCEPDERVNPLEGKLKTIQVSQDFPGSSFLLHYQYDDNGRLTSLESDSLKYFVGDKTGNATIITLWGINPFSAVGSSQKFKIYTDSDNYVRGIYLIDTVTLVETLMTRLDYDPVTGIDSIYDVGSPLFYKEATGYDYVFDGNNYTGQKISWYVMQTIGFWTYEWDEVSYAYTPLVYDYPLPSQMPYLGMPYAAGGYMESNMFLHIMEVNGYKTFKKNKNLIRSYTSIHKGYTTNFNYILNTQGQVAEMKISTPDGTGIFRTYTMTYY